MAKRRYTMDAESGVLRDRDGNALGAVVSLTLDDRPTGGQGGAVRDSGTTDPGSTPDEGRGVGEPSRPTATQLERAAVERVWEHWREVSGRNQKIDDKRGRIIRNALTTIKAVDECDLAAAEEKVKLALTGLSLSPWHRGENEMRRQYMEVRYALKGRGDESDDERIEKACDWASVYAPGRQSTLDPDRAMRYLEEVREYCGRLAIDPSATTGRDRAVEALRKLRRGGYEIARTDRPPWARFS